MKPVAFNRRSQEIELKLALLTADPSSLAGRLNRIPPLARRKSTRLHLYNIYYDAPEQILRQQRIALRIRRVGSDAKPHWLQTLKTAGPSDSALSQRGEWEVPVPGAALSLQALEGTPWSSIDPDGTVFMTLKPCFVTTFQRTSWLVRRRDGSVVEVALDIGQIETSEKSTPICELELELKAGQPTALFDIAQQIARTIATLPLSASKSERGYALAQNCLNMPLHAQPPKLTPDLSVPEAARRVLREMFYHFTTNLNALRSVDDAEVVHQARIAWRRFRSACRLFGPVLVNDAVPSWQALRSLLTFLGELRDLDVAQTDTLAPLADAYTAGDAQREKAWQATALALRQAATLRRKSVRYALQNPTVGATFLAITQWLEGWSASAAPVDAKSEPQESLRRWARRRIVRVHEQLKVACKDTGNPVSEHRARILAKRLRYAIDYLHPFLPKRRAKRWYLRATSLQESIGNTRDVMQACALVAKLEADRGLVEFLRGVAAGRTQPT